MKRKREDKNEEDLKRIRYKIMKVLLSNKGSRNCVLSFLDRLKELKKKFKKKEKFELCQEFFFKSNIYNIRNSFYLLSHQNLGKLCNKYCKIHTNLKTHRVDDLVNVIFGKKSNRKKRKIEQKQISNLDDQILFQFGETIIPKELILEIFSYLEKNLKNLNNIGLVNQKFYIVFLMSWNKITVNQENIHKIPVLVLMYSKFVHLHINDKFYVKDIKYIESKLKNCKCLTLQNNPIRFFKYVKEKIYCRKVNIQKRFSSKLLTLPGNIFPLLNEVSFSILDGAFNLILYSDALKNLETIRFNVSLNSIFNFPSILTLPKWLEKTKVKKLTIDDYPINIEILKKIKFLKELTIRLYTSGYFDSLQKDVICGLSNVLIKLKIVFRGYLSDQFILNKVLMDNIVKMEKLSYVSLDLDLSIIGTSYIKAIINSNKLTELTKKIISMKNINKIKIKIETEFDKNLTVYRNELFNIDYKYFDSRILNNFIINKTEDCTANDFGFKINFIKYKVQHFLQKKIKK